MARTYVMMDYDITTRARRGGGGTDPGHREPDGLARWPCEGWVAVRAMVPRAGAQRLMDELYDVGARAILLTDIHACRL